MGMMERRFTSFCFTLRPCRAQVEAYCRHAGAARFAYNQALALHIEAKQRAAVDPDGSVPYSGFDFINAFNAWKRSPEAGGTIDAPGLPWREEVFQGVFEEACVDLGRALEGRAAWFRGDRKGRCPGRARFKKRGRCRPSFRIRHKSGRGGGTVRFAPVGVAGSRLAAREVHLPAKLGGVVRVREDTRRIRRLLAKGDTKLRFVTVWRDGDRWKLSVTLETGSLHHALQVPHAGPPVGIDRGLLTFAVLATATGAEVERIAHPRPLRAALPRLRRLSRAHARKRPGSSNQRRAQRRLRRCHARIRNVRQDFLRRVTSRLAQTHGQLVLETLNTKGLMRTRMARSLADSAWAQFATRLHNRAKWHGGIVLQAERTLPSTRRCSHCGHVGEALPLSQRRFHCTSCGFDADRDTNAAANLAQLAHAEAAPRSTPNAAEKPSEARNACRGESAGATRSRPRCVELSPMKQE